MSNSIQTTFWKKANENFNSRYAPDVEQLDVQPFMAHDIFTLNIFDEEVKNHINSKSTKKLSKEQLNKLVILLKYFLRTGISIYHFANNDFTKKFVYSDNSTINKYLNILQDVELITFSKFRNEKNPKLQGYSINPTKALNFAISLKDNNRFTRGKKKKEDFEENIISDLDEEENIINGIYENEENNFYCNEKEDENIMNNFLSSYEKQSETNDYEYVYPDDEIKKAQEKIKERIEEFNLFKMTSSPEKNESYNIVIEMMKEGIKEVVDYHQDIGGNLPPIMRIQLKYIFDKKDE